MARLRTFEFETCIPPAAMIRVLRELADEAGWRMKRIEGSRMVDRWAIIMPLAQNARTLGLAITSGPLKGVEMHSWSHTAGSAGAVHHSVWHHPRTIDSTIVDLLVRHWAGRLPRCPWRWTAGEKITIGFLLPVFRRSRKAFAGFDIPVKRRMWPQIGLHDWPPEHLTGEEE